MDEYQPPEAALVPDPAIIKVPVATYLMAVVSGVFITFGVMFLAAFSHLFVGNQLATASKPVLAAVPLVAVGLGLLTAWQTVRQERRKLSERAKAGKSSR